MPYLRRPKSELTLCPNDTLWQGICSPRSDTKLQAMKKKKNEKATGSEDAAQTTAEATADIKHENGKGESNDTSQETNELTEVDRLAAELAAMKDKYTRLMADFDNARKRHARERIELIQNAGADLMKELLPVLDDFERAEAAHKASGNEEALEGSTLIHNKLRRTLEAKGLKPMEAMHTVFDTEYHEAITNIPAPSDELKGKVVDVVEKGYYINEQVLRYAKVVVGQ